MAMHPELVQEILTSADADKANSAETAKTADKSLATHQKAQSSTDLPPGGLALSPLVDHQTADAATAVKQAMAMDEDKKRNREQSADEKSAAENAIQTLMQWQEILAAIREHREHSAIRFVNYYESFLSKEVNQSFIITLVAKAIKADMTALLQRVLGMVRLAAIEKAFTFKHMMLPMMYAINHHASRPLIEVLQKAGASMKAEYAPNQDVTAAVRKRLSSQQHEMPDFAVHADSPANHSAGFMPSFSRQRVSPLAVNFAAAAGNSLEDSFEESFENSFISPHNLPAYASAVSPYHASDLGRLEKQTAQPQEARQAEQQRLDQKAADLKPAVKPTVGYSAASAGSIGSAAAASAESQQIDSISDQNSEFFAYDATSFNSPLNGVAEFGPFGAGSHDNGVPIFVNLDADAQGSGASNDPYAGFSSSKFSPERYR